MANEKLLQKFIDDVVRWKLKQQIEEEKKAKKKGGRKDEKKAKALGSKSINNN